MAEDRKKAGFVVLVGRSNVGKSTLLNALIGTKVAITTPKPQTTRHAIQGVVNDERGQVVLVDTPGIFRRAPDRLTSRLNEKARESLEGIDAVIYVVDPTRHVGEEEEIVRRLVDAVDKPKILVLNKRDLQGEFRDEYLDWQDDFDAVVEISALQEKGVARLLDVLFPLLPEGDRPYPDDLLTNLSDSFRLEELIREKVFLTMRDEIPYSTTVRLHETADRKDRTLYLRASVITESPRYKRMLIGQGGLTIKRIGQAVRKELEAVTGRKVYVDLDVVVEERWKEAFE
ncbi:hypothetical protein AMJ57_00995 [Parcubacteria bacterium SG8_24]|nr:MAG: hypothetical protein AMJ57_00995 [Parcubacteria bacterium SG8_24]